MTLLLVNTNRETTPQPVLPIGLLRCAEACDEAGIDVQILDLAFARKPADALAAAVARHTPELIGLGVRNIDNCDAISPRFYTGEVRPLVDRLREVTKAPVVVGGAGPSLAPAEAREVLAVDHVVGGPGDVALPELYESVTSGQEAPPVIQGKQVALTKPSPDYARWLDLKPYRRRGTPIGIQSRTGCPFSCVYCNYSGIEGSRYEMGDVDVVLDALQEQVKRTKLKAAEFVDSTFNSPPKFAQQLCEGIASRGLKLSLGASGITPRHSSRPLLEAMRAAGFDTMWCSPDTASPVTIESYGKGFELEQLSQMVKDTAAVGIRVMWAFMFGGPGETEETVAETLRFIQEEIRPIDPVMFAARMRIYPGTKLEQLAAEEGYPKTVLDPFAPGQFYTSPHIVGAKLEELLCAAERRLTNVVFMDASQTADVKLWQHVFALIGRKVPVWADAPKLRWVKKKMFIDRPSGGPRGR